jgi:hypothetical protein
MDVLSRDELLGELELLGERDALLLGDLVFEVGEFINLLPTGK